MSARTKRILRKVISHIGVLFFALAAAMLYFQLREYSFSGILDAVMNIPKLNLLVASVLCVMEYLTLSVYDFMALKYVGRKLAWWKWMLAGSFGFAISNNAGNAAVSGAAIRYRLYTRWRIRAGELVKMLAFSGVTYYLGAATVLLIGFFFLPSNSSGSMLNVLFFVCLALWVFYVGLCFQFRGKTFKIGKLVFKVPSGSTALKQCGLGATDSILAAMILYFLTRNVINIPVIEFISIFVVAQGAGIFAQVPGGIGVFESVFLMSMPDGTDKAALFGCLLVFRIVFFLLPLVGIGILFVIYERWLKKEMKKWHVFAHAKWLNKKAK
jgi:phosphatidylglycerol lysyltransferase